MIYSIRLNKVDLVITKSYIKKWYKLKAGFYKKKLFLY